MNTFTITHPLDVPPEHHSTYENNYQTMTHNTGRLMLFAGDQKIEHLNKDFYGDGIPQDDNEPEHLFRIAQKAKIGVFAAQLGLIARYAGDYPDVPYLVKLNSKTNLVKTAQKDPESRLLWSVADVVELKKNANLNVLGVGYTLYLGSAFEPAMLTEAASVVQHAHRFGLISVIWCYPRGAAVTDEKDPALIAGAAGVAACLGADFVKVNAPKDGEISSAEALKQATHAAGRTKVVCAGGSSKSAESFLTGLYEQIHVGGTMGNATGRNIHQRPLEEAVRMANAIYAITVEDKTADEALSIYTGS